MAKQYIIIDGYNLMHASGFARLKYGPGDLERQRNRFLSKLAGLLTESERVLSSVIFDAFESRSNDDRVNQFEGLTYEFALSGEDADSLIEELIQKHSAPKQVLVVSSDHRLQKAARRRKARSIDSDKYWNNLTSRIIADSPEKIKNSDQMENIDAGILDKLQDEIDQIIDEE